MGFFSKVGKTITGMADAANRMEYEYQARVFFDVKEEYDELKRLREMVRKSEELKELREMVRKYDELKELLGSSKDINS